MQFVLPVLKSYVTTSYALDNTLHAICYHHVENQRGSLVTAQHSLQLSIYNNLDTRQCVRQVRAKKPTHRPWVILHEPFRAKFDPPITQNLFYLRI
ncbi:hypothetical protein SFRURICE_000859 [Spodoptera frugiperda]|nr:hypothetical protein SFRURICE_000859 [Spodoptera frugiperda]